MAPWAGGVPPVPAGLLGLAPSAGAQGSATLPPAARLPLAHLAQAYGPAGVPDALVPQVLAGRRVVGRVRMRWTPGSPSPLGCTTPRPLTIAAGPREGSPPALL